MIKKKKSRLIKKILASATMFGGLFFGNPSFSQDLLEFGMKFDTIQVKEYKHEKTSKMEKKLYLQTSYAGYKILNPEAIKNIKDQLIYNIELIYTNYPEKVNFETLNKKRLSSLYQLSPELFRNPLIEWTTVIQTDCNAKNVYDMFHGFAITYRPPATSSTILSEKRYIKELLENKVKMLDSTIYKIMKRNKWENMTIVTDFTGSMSPYIGELLLWHKLNLEVNKERIKRFVFFNDGDRKETNEKIIGETEGIYHTQQIRLDSVVNTALTVISNGYGGDSPENDIEALIFAQEKNPKSNLVLIADNWSNMRDLSLAKKLKTPVKIILCGAQRYVNVEYLYLADVTKGSIHTIEEDIINLHTTKIGEIISINGAKYKKINEKYIPLR